MNFEVNAFIYNSATAQELDEIFIKDMYDSTEITLEKFNQRPLKDKQRCHMPAALPCYSFS